MKKILLFLSCLITAISLQAQLSAHKLEWAKQMGSSSHDRGTCITTDPGGNIYVCGGFSGFADLDPGGGVFPGTSHGGLDIFITKLDPGGNFLWSKTLGGPLDDYAKSITVTNAGYVITTGVFNGSMDMDPGGGGFLEFASGPEDIFVSMLDGFGNFIWGKRMGGLAMESGMSIVADLKRNLLTTGSYRHIADFNPGPFTSNSTAVGGSDIFVSKLNEFGNYVWHRSVGTDSDDVAYGIETDLNYYYYVVGSIKGSGDFDPGVGKFKVAAYGQEDAFLLVLNEFGNFRMAKQFSGNGVEVARSVTVDPSGNIYITGYFNGTADFNPSDTATYELTAQGTNDIFVVCLNATGAFKWAKNIGAASSNCIATSIKLDISKNVFITGSFTGTVDFDPGPAVRSARAVGTASDIFISKMDSNGNFKWVKKLGGIEDDSALAIEVDMAGNLYTTGSFRNLVDFDPTFPGYVPKLSDGQSDIFIQKLGGCSSDTIVMNETHCERFSMEGQSYTSSGTYEQTISSPSGCDRFVTLNLNISPRLNDSVTKSGVTLTCKAAGATYQWIECPSGKILPGATARSYIAIGSGKYAVIVTNGVCTDTSDCMEVKDVPIYNGIDNYSKNNSVKVFPNPSQGDITIEADEPMTGASAVIYNILGQKVSSFELKTATTTQTLDKGVYLIEFTKGTQRSTERIIVH